MLDNNPQAIHALRRRLALLEQQAALDGFSADPRLKLEIEDIRKQLAQLPVFDLVLEEAKPTSFPGLILLVSPSRFVQSDGSLNQSAYDAIDFHRTVLRHCWLIGSSGEQGSLTVAMEIQQWCRQRKISASVYEITDPTSVQASYDLINWIYREAVPQSGLSEDAVIADITGATKPLTVGMVLACGIRRPMQYMVRQASGPSLPIRLNYRLSSGV